MVNWNEGNEVFFQRKFNWRPHHNVKTQKETKQFVIRILFLLSVREDFFTEMGSTRNRRKTDPEIVIARDTDSELSSEEEEEEDNNPLSESEEEDEAVKNGGKIELEKNKAKGKAPITVKLKKVCKVTLFENPSLSHFESFYFRLWFQAWSF